MIDQPAQDSLRHWLYTNAPAAWTSAVIAFSLFIWNLALRKRPKRLVIRENENISYTQLPKVFKVFFWPFARTRDTSPAAIQKIYAGAWQK